MKNPVDYFEIPVNDLDRAINFYQVVFGYEFERAWVDGNEMAWFPMSENIPGISGALAKGDSYTPATQGTRVYFCTDNIEDILAKVNINGGKTLYPKTSIGELGWVAEFEDSEGNRIALHLPETTQSTETSVFPPGDLYSDEPPLESYLHLRQLLLLLSCLEWFWRDRNDFFAAGNLTVYYSPRQRKSEDFRGPDFFVVLGTERKPRKSWVVWEEDGKYPHVIIELLSDSTANTDRGLKKQIYQDTFRTLDYFWFDPDSLEFEGFHLVDGQYESIAPNSQGWRWSQQLQLFLGIEDRKLRFFTPEGQLVPTPEESAQIEQQQRLVAEQRASEAEVLLAQYRDRFGELPKE